MAQGDLPICHTAKFLPKTRAAHFLSLWASPDQGILLLNHKQPGSTWAERDVPSAWRSLAEPFPIRTFGEPSAQGSDTPASHTPSLGLMWAEGITLGLSVTVLAVISCSAHAAHAAHKAQECGKRPALNLCRVTFPNNCHGFSKRRQAVPQGDGELLLFCAAQQATGHGTDHCIDLTSRVRSMHSYAFRCIRSMWNCWNDSRGVPWKLPDSRNTSAMRTGSELVFFILRKEKPSST